MRSPLRSAVLCLSLVVPTPALAQTVKLEPAIGGLLGRMVESQESKDLGRIVDILVDAAGAPEAAVIDFGGFLGVGNRRIAVAWSALRFGADDKGALTVSLDIPSDRIKAAPNYVEGQQVHALTPTPAP